MHVFVGIDLQNDFIGGALAVEGASDVVHNIIRHLQESEYDKYFFTMDYHNNEETYLYTPEGVNLPIPHCIIGTHGHNLDKDILSAIRNNVDSEFITSFISKSSFYTPELPLQIERAYEHRRRFYDDDQLSITVVGLCTDICVISNVLALRGHFPEAYILVISNCCAGTTPEQHQAALKIMQSNAIQILQK